MHEVIYVSEAQPDLGSDEIFRIIEQSARNNPLRDITGFLMVGEAHFLQLIEGPLQSLESLLTTLRMDPRHHSLQVLSQRSIYERSFPRWRMKRVGDGIDALGELRAVLASERSGAVIPREVVAFVEERGRRRVSSAAA